MPDFVLNGAVVERLESYKYLGFVVHATKAMTFGTSFLVAAEGEFCHAAAVCTSGHQGSCYAVQAI